MERLSVLVVEDEPLTQEYICALVAEDPELKLLGGCGTVAEGLAAINAEQPDLLLLDVQLPEGDGFVLLGALEELPAVIFITAYDRYALRAFRVHAVDYLLKPFERERFREAIGRAKAQLRSSGVEAMAMVGRLRALLTEMQAAVPNRPERLMIKAGGRVTFLPVVEIDWIEAKGNYVQLHAGREAYRLRESLSALEEKLDQQCFVRIHRSFIVNLEQVREFQPWFHGEYIVILKDGTKLKLTRRYKVQVEAQLGGRL